MSIVRRNCHKTQNDLSYIVVGLLRGWGLVLRAKVRGGKGMRWSAGRWHRWEKVQVRNNMLVAEQAPCMHVGEQAQVRGENTIQVRRKIQYSQEKGKTGKVMCDYIWLGAARRCNQKTVWDLTRKGNNAQGGLLGSHTSPLKEGNCEDKICSRACTWRQILNVC